MTTFWQGFVHQCPEKAQQLLTKLELQAEQAENQAAKYRRTAEAIREALEGVRT